MQRFVVVGILCLSTWAHAGDSKAWTAARKVLPGNLTAVVGINIATLRGSDLYKQVAPVVLAKKTDAASHIDEVKQACGTDVTGFVDSMVVGVDDSGKATVVIALRSWGQKEVEGCLTKMAKAHARTYTTEKSGDFTHYHFNGKGDDKDKDLYVKWVAKDVAVFAADPTTKDAAMGGGIDKDKALAPLLAAVHTDAAVWAAVNKTSAVPQSTAKVTGMYGTADDKTGNVSLELHVLFDSEKGAADTATKTTAMLPMLSAQVPKMAALVKSMKLTANGKDLVVTASDTEKDVADIIIDTLSH